ncbi:MAG TPA: PHP-associated domain-containing protein [Terriglobia bacterium]|nr:PHP-associated domain-containing protein [Terriglobia bacterium]
MDYLFKADLHCHSHHSGRVNHLKFLCAKDCYSKPIDVYRRAKARGMNLVTITDHDSIGGCLELLDRYGEMPDFIMGEEVSAALPQFKHTIHIAVYGHTEAQHREIQSLRQDGAELVAYLRASDLLFVLNHFFHDFSNSASLREFIEQMAEWFDVFEVRNGTMQREHNKFIVDLLEQYRNRTRPLSMVAGSDSHTLRRIGRSFTASAARNREEFLADVRAGRTQVFGPHSNHLTLAADIYGVVLRYYPMVFSVRNGEFSPLARLQKFFLSVVAAPFLFTPYVAAVRHSAIERSRIQQYTRLYFGSQTS